MSFEDDDFLSEENLNFHDKIDIFPSSSLAGRPFGVVIGAGNDGTNAAKQVNRICQGWRLKPVREDAILVRNHLKQTPGNVVGAGKEKLFIQKSTKINLNLNSNYFRKIEEECRELGGLVTAWSLIDV